MANTKYPPEGTSFDVASADANQVNAIATDFGHRGGTSHLILSLLLVGRPLASCLPLFMPFRLRNTHFATQICKLNKAVHSNKCVYTAVLIVNSATIPNY